MRESQRCLACLKKQIGDVLNGLQNKEFPEHKRVLFRFCLKISTKTVTATAHEMALIFYNMLKYGAGYVDLGQEYYDRAIKIA